MRRKPLSGVDTPGLPNRAADRQGMHVAEARAGRPMYPVSDYAAVPPTARNRRFASRILGQTCTNKTLV